MLDEPKSVWPPPAQSSCSYRITCVRPPTMPSFKVSAAIEGNHSDINKAALGREVCRRSMNRENLHCHVAARWGRKEKDDKLSERRLLTLYFTVLPNSSICSQSYFQYHDNPHRYYYSHHCHQFIYFISTSLTLTKQSLCYRIITAVGLSLSLALSLLILFIHSSHHSSSIHPFVPSSSISPSPKVMAQSLMR